MEETMHQVLLDADCPPNFSKDKVYVGDGMDVFDAVERAGSVRKELARAFKRYFTLDDRQQDAFFWGTIAEPLNNENASERPVVIRFSYCGNLAATWTIPGFGTLSNEEKQLIEKVLMRSGFTWVDGDILMRTDYDGVYEYFKTCNNNGPASWWDRFFEYE